MNDTRSEEYEITLLYWERFQNLSLLRDREGSLDCRQHVELLETGLDLVEMIHTHGFVAMAHWVLVHGIKNENSPLVRKMVEVLEKGGELGRWHESAWRKAKIFHKKKKAMVAG